MNCNYNIELLLSTDVTTVSRETIITVCHLTFVSLTGLFDSLIAIWSVKMSIQFNNTIEYNTPVLCLMQVKQNPFLLMKLAAAVIGK